MIKKYTIFKIAFGMILLLISIINIYYLIKSINIIPFKYNLIIIGISLLLILISFIFFKTKRLKLWIVILYIISFISLISLSFFLHNKINYTIKFINENLNIKYETNIYNLVVNSKSKINNINDIEGKTIKLVNDIETNESLIKLLNKKIKNVKIVYVENASSLLYEIENNNETIVLVNSGNYDAIIKEEPKYINKVKILDNIEIAKRIENVSTGIDITKDTFIIYLSGIDTRSNKLPAKSLSDANIILVINPIYKKILMINTPRDYYINLHEINLKDKLAHTGIVGGINMSLKTLEDLYNIKIPYYVRINFKAVIKLVDAIDGITLYNQNKSFKSTSDNNCIFKKGNNNVNGKCALAFARERYIYTDGDRQRGKNQEQVIQKVIEKITSSKILISKYTNILKSLNNTFETNITVEEIVNFIKMQLDDMSKWSIDTYNVTGKDSYAFTYSYPKRKIYVMKPNIDTIKEAQNKIKETLTNNIQ